MKKRIFLAILIVLCVAGGVAFYKLSQPPKETLSKDFKEQALSKLLGRKAQLDAVVEKKGNVSFNGKYITFDYPAKAIIYTLRDQSSTASASFLEDFSFDIKEPRLIFNMAVVKTASNIKNVADDSGVLFRKNNPGQYKDVSTTVNGVNGKIYERDDESPEKTAFFLVNGRFYTISVTGNNFDDIKKLADDLLKTVKFK